MKLMKSEYPRRSISFLYRKDCGQIGWSVGFFFLVYLSVLMFAILSLEELRFSSDYLEDALAASNLASAIVDLEEYGISHTLRLTKKEEAYQKYETAIKGNLNLDNDWNCPNRRLISGKVCCEIYIMYNVYGGNVEILERGRDGAWRRTEGRLGEVAAPNGVKVEHTGIYSEISFPVKSFSRMEITARKGKLVDIVGR